MGGKRGHPSSRQKQHAKGTSPLSGPLPALGGRSAMSCDLNVRKVYVWVLLGATTLAMTAGTSCPVTGDNTRPVVPPGNRPPRIIITSVTTPGGTSLAEQGDPVSIAFTGEDAEDAAIARVFVSTQANPTPAQEIPILAGFPVGPGTANGVAIWDTSATPTGIYNIFAEIDDRTFDPFTGSGNAAVRVTWSSTIIVSPPGTAPTNGPPVLLPKLPGIDIGLGNEDNLIVRFDVSDPNPADSIALTVFLDTDRDASNDATSPPIQLDTSTIPASTAPIIAPLQVERVILINLANIPLRRETDQFGRPLPYFVRIRANDGKGGVVNAYTQGAVRLLASASGVVDMLSVGGRIAGATFQGFGGNPTDPRKGDHAGSTFAPLGDMDLDGIDDFAIVAETASPFGDPNVGQAYAIYGRPRAINPDLPNSGYFQGRLSGVLDLNTVGSFVSFPPSDPRYRNFFRIRGQSMPHSHETGTGSPSLGITSIMTMPDETGDFRPEMFIGAPLTTSVIDVEDIDPCDTCRQDGSFTCLDPDIEEELTGNVQNLPQGTIQASTWVGGDPTLLTSNGTPNVNLGLGTKRIVSIEAVTVSFSGQVPNTMGMASFNIEVQFEGQCGLSRSIPVTTQMGGAFDDMTATSTFVPLDGFPVGQGEAFPPSMYDGLFRVFVNPSIGVQITTIEVTVNCHTREQRDIPFLFRYFDGLPSPISDNGACGGGTPVGIDPAILPLAVSEIFDPVTGGPACPPINRAPMALSSFRIGSSPIPPIFLTTPADPSGMPRPFINDSGIYNSFLDGHVCDDVMTYFGNQPSNGGDDVINDYESGIVYCAVSNELLTTINDQGVWEGNGCPVQPLGQFGQRYGGCLNDAIRGARFRGAWYHPANEGDGLGNSGERSFVYDPYSLFGYTVDVMPDIDTIFGSSELIISAPGGGMLEAVEQDLTSQFAGLYLVDNSPPFPNPPNLTKNIANFDLNTQFSRVLSARLRIRGRFNVPMLSNHVAKNLPRLRMSILDSLGMPIAGTDSTLLMWGGPGAPPMGHTAGELLYKTFFGNLAMPGGPPPCADYFLSYPIGLDIALPVTPDLELGLSPAFSAAFATVGSLLSTGQGSLSLEILEDCTIENSSVEITEANFTVVGLSSGWGNVTLVEGQDYTNDEQISAACNSAFIETGGDPEGGAARPMSWPSAGCDSVPNHSWRENCYPQNLAYLTGEARGDAFGWAHYAGDVDFDGVADIICGAPLSDNDPFAPDLDNCPCGTMAALEFFQCSELGFDEPARLTDNGKCYLIYGEAVLQNGPPCRYERFEVRGSHNDDQFGRVQGRIGDMNGDTVDDVFVAAENYDATGGFGGIQNRGVDAGFVGVLFGGFTLTGEIAVNAEQIGTGSFHGCKFIGGSAGVRLGGSEPAKVDSTYYPVTPPLFPTSFDVLKPIIDRGQNGVSSAGDYNRDGFNDLLITAPGQEWPGAKIQFLGGVTDGSTITINGRVFEFDTGGGVAAGRVRVPVTTATALGAQAALFSVLETSQADESLNISAVTSRTDFPDPLPDTPTITFLARTPAGFGVSSATGTVPVTQFTRKGVAYLIFGNDVLLNDKTFYLPEDLNRRVGGNRILKGIVFVSSFEKNTAAENDGIYDPAETPDEAPIEAVSAAGDVDGDGFPDILLGAPRADFINIVAPNQRRQASGEAYLIYGNEFGLNSPSSP